MRRAKRGARDESGARSGHGRGRGVVIGVVLAVGVLASIASNPVEGNISGQSDSFALTLEQPGDSHDATATATLRSDQPLLTGELNLSVEVDSGSVGSLSFAIQSDVTGESNSADIFDPEAQPSADIGIAAFEGCAGGADCGEELTLSFARVDEDASGALSFTWSLSGFASAEVAEGEVATGTLEFDVQE